MSKHDPRPKARGGMNTWRDWHTAGEWKAHETETRIAIKSGKRVVAYVQIGIHQDGNAALIACAPRLLRLARQYASECGDCAGVGVDVDGVECPDCKEIRDVIAMTVPQ